MRRNVKQSGFTLIEATVAMILLVIASAGILLPFADAMSVQDEGARQTMAASLASELMEKVLATNYTDILTTYSSYQEDDGGLLDAAGIAHTGSAYSGFSRSASCQAASVGSVNLIAVSVIVSFDGVEMTHVTTLIGDHE